MTPAGAATLGATVTWRGKENVARLATECHTKGEFKKYYRRDWEEMWGEGADTSTRQTPSPLESAQPPGNRKTRNLNPEFENQKSTTRNRQPEIAQGSTKQVAETRQ